MKPPSEMTWQEMDAVAAKMYGTLSVSTKKKAEAAAVKRLGEYIRELGRRNDVLMVVKAAASSYGKSAPAESRLTDALRALDKL